MTKIKEGDDIGATFLNRHDEAADWVLRNKLRGEGGSIRPTPVNFSKVMAANYTGQQIYIGDVCEFDGNPFADPDIRENYPDPRNDRWLKAVTPNAERLGWGIALDPIGPATGDDREGGEFLTLGVCHAKVKIVDEDHKYAERESGERVLKSAAKGPVKILHKPTGGTPPEERMCLVQLMDEGSPQVQLVRAASESTYPLASTWFERGSGTTPPQANVFSFRTGYTLDFDDTQDHVDPFATLPDEDPTYIRALNLTGHYVPENQWCLAYTLNGKYVVEYELPRVLTVTLLGDLLPDGYTTATVYSNIAPSVSLGTIRVYDFYTPGDRKFAAGQKATAVLTYDSGWKYKIATIENCAAEV